MIRGQIIFGTDYVLLVGSGLVTRPHRHLSASITISLDEPFLVRLGSDGEPRAARLLAMRPDTEHAVEAPNSRLVNLQIDPETVGYARLKGAILESEKLVIREEMASDWLDTLQALATQPPVLGHRVTGFLLDTLGLPSSPPIGFDRRVAQALAIMKASFPESPSSGELAEQVGLSESRLIHLFSEQVGVPLRRYTLWLRLRHVLFCVATGDNLTDAAHEAGFSDSAHLARVFSSMFGITPSSMLRSEHVTRSFELPEMPLSGPHAAQDAERLARLLSAKTGLAMQPGGGRSPESQ